VKRFVRISVWVLAAFILIALASVVLCLDGVDTRPYFKESYYRQTSDRLRDCAETNKLARGQLSAGFGRARLSPIVNAPQDAPADGRFRTLPLAGYGNRHGKPARGVHDDIYIKAVAFKVADRVGVMVGADALIIPREVAELATRRLGEMGLSRQQVYLSATHTHSSLGAWGQGLVAESFAGGFQPEARTWFSECIVTAVRAALADLQPAQFGHGVFPAPQFIRNRLVGGLGRVDPEFCYAVVKQDAGKLAVLGVYGAHATTLSDDMMEFSADYPGCWERAIEQATGGVAVFLAGGVGSHSPVTGGRGFAGTEQMGQALAKAVLEHLSQTPLTNSVTFGIIGLDVTLPPFNARLTDGIRLRPWLAEKLLPAKGQTFLQVFRIDNSLWVSTPCDFSGELALGIKDFLRARGSDAAITSFNGDYIGYVIPSRYYHLNGYEPRLMSFFGPNVPDYFDELIRNMSLSLVNN
jgi:neutral ceramidase